jgi:NitT/TauT family transport system ATP-binding protein
MLTVDNLGHTYRDRGHTHHALHGLRFTVAVGELVSLVGPSGCGKTTLLRAIAGLLRPTSGTITVHGQPVAGVPPAVAVVGQDYSRTLLPWRTAHGNITFALTPQCRGRRECNQLARQALDAVGLPPAAARKHPWQLSGGMQQRVAIARALAARPRLLLMDEPFGALDAQTRADLEDLLLHVRRAHGMTVLLVTHDIDEAVYLGNRVLVLSGSPSRLLADLRVDLPAKRDQITTRQHPEFVRLRTEVARLIRHPDTATAPHSATALGAEAMPAANTHGGPPR